MDDSATEKLLSEFRRIAPREPSGGPAEAGAAVLGAALIEAIAKRDDASATAEKESGGGSPALKTVLKNAFGMAPLISSLIGLFWKSDPADQAAAPAFSKYVMPARMDIQRAEGERGLTGLDYDQTGMPRGYGGESEFTAPAPRSGETTNAGRYEAAAPQITVNVQAMDSRSFLDHSAEIAAAVRNAMLHLNAINDVVSDL